MKVTRDGVAKEYVTTGQFAKTIGVATGTVRRWLNEGKIKGFSTPGGWKRIPKNEIDKMIEVKNG